MKISGNSVIHFTEELDSLFGIIENNFKPNFCIEDISPATGEEVHFAIPMISFCDIPLSNIKNHTDKYGDYGIGLTKAWAHKMRLNPVQYISADSWFSESFTKINEEALKLCEKGNVNRDDMIESLFTTISYTKLYEGDLPSKGITNYRFYDEREWRFVPKIIHPTSGDLRMLPKDDYLALGGKSEAASKYLDGEILKFEPADIAYLFVKNDKDIQPLIEHIRKSYSSTKIHGDIEILTTRILTKKQIDDDF